MFKKYITNDVAKVVVDKSKKILFHPMTFFAATAIAVYAVEKTMVNKEIKVSCKEHPGL